MRAGLSNDLIARILGSAPKYTIAELEQKFPARFPALGGVDGAAGRGGFLPDGAMVTRFAPSPTGFVHMGNVYGMLIDKMLAHQSNGVFYIRIEDTDTERKVDGAVELINSVADKLGLNPDEGPNAGGNYGPYYQSQRRDIYNAVAADLMARGLAYPCFMTKEEMDAAREIQEKAGMPTGIYGEFARDRNLDTDEITARLDAGLIPTVRLYSNGNRDKKIFCKDAVRGSLAMPEWEVDEVLIKSGDGLPTYHFAHLCDDHFMRTTHVVRGEEWLATLPLHVMLFNIMDWVPPLYIHTPTIDKIDDETGNRRKLSKRKDPEFTVSNWWKDGWPSDAILEYLFNLIASGYEEEKLKKPETTIWNYPIKVKKMPVSGALFDIRKLEWWAREFIATMTVPDLVSRVTAWANEYDDAWARRIDGHKDYLTSMLAIERDNPKRIRKDFVTWSQTLEETSYFWDDLFEKNTEFEYNKNALSAFVAVFDVMDDKDTWWTKIVNIATELGVKNGDVAMSLRVATTGRTNAPDLYSVMQVLGKERVMKRIMKVIG